MSFNELREIDCDGYLGTLTGFYYQGEWIDKKEFAQDILDCYSDDPDYYSCLESYFDEETNEILSDSVEKIASEAKHGYYVVMPHPELDEDDCDVWCVEFFKQPTEQYECYKVTHWEIE